LFAFIAFFVDYSMNIKPLADRVLIEPISIEDKTESGIILPDTADKEKPEQGRVIEVGPGRPNKPMGVKKGDKVLFTKYGPNEIKIDNKEYLIAREEDILAILE
jgi:chaperonin GroES